MHTCTQVGSEHGLVHDGLQADGYIDLRVDWQTINHKDGERYAHAHAHMRMHTCACTHAHAHMRMHICASRRADH